jgi:hypothetical protein
MARRERVHISHVFETHLHNDFLSGSRELASMTGARIVASAGAGLEFEHRPVRDGDTVRVGDVRFTVLATPGHTPEHVSYLAEDLTGSAQPAFTERLLAGMPSYPTYFHRMRTINLQGPRCSAWEQRWCIRRCWRRSRTWPIPTGAPRPSASTACGAIAGTPWVHCSPACWPICSAWRGPSAPSPP